MLIQSYGDVAGRPELYGMTAILALIGVQLITLTPRKHSVRLVAASPQ